MCVFVYQSLYSSSRSGVDGLGLHEHDRLGHGIHLSSAGCWFWRRGCVDVTHEWRQNGRSCTGAFVDTLNRCPRAWRGPTGSLARSADVSCSPCSRAWCSPRHRSARQRVRRRSLPIRARGCCARRRDYQAAFAHAGGVRHRMVDRRRLRARSRCPTGAPRGSCPTRCWPRRRSPTVTRRRSCTTASSCSAAGASRRCSVAPPSARQDLVPRGRRARVLAELGCRPGPHARWCSAPLVEAAPTAPRGSASVWSAPRSATFTCPGSRSSGSTAAVRRARRRVVGHRRGARGRHGLRVRRGRRSARTSPACAFDRATTGPWQFWTGTTWGDARRPGPDDVRRRHAGRGPRSSHATARRARRGRVPARRSPIPTIAAWTATAPAGAVATAPAPSPPRSSSPASSRTTRGRSTSARAGWAVVYNVNDPGGGGHRPEHVRRPVRQNHGGRRRDSTATPHAVTAPDRQSGASTGFHASRLQ